MLVKDTRKLKSIDQSWLFFFAFTTWLLFMLFLFVDAPRKLLQSLDAKAQLEQADQVRRVLLENPETKDEKEKKTVVYWSKQNVKARGKLTRNKGFEAKTLKDKLSFAKRGQIQNQKYQKKSSEENSIALRKLVSFRIRLFEEKKSREKGFGGNTSWGKKKTTSIPHDYRFRKRFAFSWDRNGEPRIPAKYFKHYDYFKSMFNKIRDHWAPPGGQPFPTFGDDYHRMSYTPGRMTYQTFPEQAIQIVFSLDETGDVAEVKLWNSHGYKSLDQSLLDAIWRSRNFGPPPPEMMQNGFIVIPANFQIFSR